MCPDCNDGFYYPFAGPREPCQTCCPKNTESCAPAWEDIRPIETDETTYPQANERLVRYHDTEVREARKLSKERQRAAHISWEANKPTDWEHWFPTDGVRSIYLASILREHPTKLETELKPGDAGLEVIRHIFEAVPLYEIRRFFSRRNFVYLGEFLDLYNRER